MKTASLACRFLFAAALPVSLAHAQLVHLTFTEPTGQMLFRATSGLIPWDHAAGEVTQFELFYDPSTAEELDDSFYAFSDPTRNFWRAKVETNELPDGFSHFTVTRPLQNMYLTPEGLNFSYFDAGDDVSLDFTASPGSPFLDEAGYPLPPPERATGADTVFFTLSGGPSVFNVPDLTEGYGYGQFARITAETIITPVPEPAVFGAAAIGLLALAAFVRRSRNRVAA